MEKRDIHHYKERVEYGKKNIMNSNLTEANKQTIMRFTNYCIAQPITNGRVAKYIYTLKKIGLLLDKDFENVKRDDIIRIMGIIEQTDYTEETKRDYKVTLKKFYKWLRDTEEFPHEVSFLKATIKKNKEKMPELLLTPEDIRNMASKSDNVRDKCLILITFETGARIGEILNIRIKDLYFDKYGCVIQLYGKTGPRKCRIVECVADLTVWLRMHPAKEDNQSFLFVNMGQNRSKPIEYSYVRHIFRDLAKRAGITKPVNPHHFRHSRATYLCGTLTGPFMNSYFGWAPGSKMWAVYLAIGSQHLDAEVLEKVHGIKVEKPEKKPIVMKCPRCVSVPKVGDLFCNSCGLPLNMDAAINIDKPEEETGM